MKTCWSLAVGGGLYGAALFATAIMLGILVVLKPIENRLLGRWRKDRVTVTWDPERCELSSVSQAVQRSKTPSARVEIDYHFTGGANRSERVDLVVTSRSLPAGSALPGNYQTVIALIGQLKKLQGILTIESTSLGATITDAPDEEETR
jgi:uncharacterized membrane protein YhiD involved in acid resistance